MSGMQFLQLDSNNVTSNLFSTVRKGNDVFVCCHFGELGEDDSRVIVKHLVKVKTRSIIKASERRGNSTAVEKVFEAFR